MDEYKIYLVNNNADAQQFWCFLERPQELASDPGVFANSAATLLVRPNEVADTNLFDIPAQYKVGASASNNAVGLNVKVQSDILENADLGDVWKAEYFDTPPPQGPELSKGDNTGSDTIQLVSNNFNKTQNEDDGWFSSQSFGIETASGFMGMTWSPKTGQTRTISPKLKFYVTIGSYGANELAAWTDIANDSQAIELSDFLRNECTVTYSETGKFSVLPGPPPPKETLLHALAESHASLTKAHRELTTLIGANLVSSSSDTRTVTSVDLVCPRDRFDEEMYERLYIDELGGFVVGTITVGAAVAVGVTVFTLAGLHFSITKVSPDRKIIHFSYNGRDSCHGVAEVLKEGAKIKFV